MYPFEATNHSLFLLINGGAAAPSWEVRAAIIIAQYLIYLLPLLLVVMWLWGDRERRSQAVKATLVTALALGIGQLISLVMPHPRPFMIGLGHTWIAHAADSSFPSDHMTVFAGIGLSLLVDGVVGLAAPILITAVAVAWSRVFLGVHFPFDMVGAVAVVAMSSLSISLFWRRAGGQLMDTAERLYRLVFSIPIASGVVRR